MVDKKVIGEMLNTNPLSLLAIKDEQVIDKLNSLIPYSSAFEIECDKSEEYNEDCFKNIPDIMAVQNDICEQRYRIPNGLRGIICLYNISYQLKLNSLLNPLSSIHYHVDCTGCYREISQLISNDDNIKYILSELDTWLEGEQATGRGIQTWFRPNPLQTIEFRLGEMTFDYRRMLKRIMHCNAMVKKFKDELGIEKPTYEAPNKKKILTYYKEVLKNTPTGNRILSLNKKLEELSSKELKSNPNIVEEVKSQYRNRVHFINK